MRAVRPLLGAILVLGLIPPVAALCFVIALAQLVQWRDLRCIFFIQSRAGLRGRPFRIIKFRTLREPRGDGAAGTMVATRLGAILRKTHLDELPQLWNVVRRDMSLIGPRPETISIEAWAEGVLPGFGERLIIRPGITGLAQVVQDSTPPVMSFYAEKLRLNRLYVASASLRLDFIILARTALRPLRPRAFHRIGGLVASAEAPETRPAALKAG